MPWPTTSGLRNLAGAEADLIRGAVGMMVDTHVAELREQAEPWQYGVAWFDQWDVGQRLWLLERVCNAFFGDQTIDPSAAIFDAAADAIFYEVNDLIQIEIDQQSPTKSQRSWRQSVIDAAECQNRRLPEIDPLSVNLAQWQATVTRIADSILGIRLYQRAESFRDVPFGRTEKFLRDRGLPDDYLATIPPLRSDNEIQESIDQIQRYVFE